MLLFNPLNVFKVLSGEIPWTSTLHLNAGIQTAVLIAGFALIASAITYKKEENREDWMLATSFALFLAFIAILAGPAAWLLLLLALLIGLIRLVGKVIEDPQIVRRAMMAPCKKLSGMNKNRKPYPPGFEKLR